MPGKPLVKHCYRRPGGCAQRPAQGGLVGEYGHRNTIVPAFIAILFLLPGRHRRLQQQFCLPERIAARFASSCQQILPPAGPAQQGKDFFILHLHHQGLCRQILVDGGDTGWFRLRSIRFPFIAAPGNCFCRYKCRAPLFLWDLFQSPLRGQTIRISSRFAFCSGTRCRSAAALRFHYPHPPCSLRVICRHLLRRPHFTLCCRGADGFQPPAFTGVFFPVNSGQPHLAFLPMARIADNPGQQHWQAFVPDAFHGNTLEETMHWQNTCGSSSHFTISIFPRAIRDVAWTRAPLGHTGTDRVPSLFLTRLPVWNGNPLPSHRFISTVRHISGTSVQKPF